MLVRLAAGRSAACREQCHSPVPLVHHVRSQRQRDCITRDGWVRTVDGGARDDGGSVSGSRGGGGRKRGRCEAAVEWAHVERGGANDMVSEHDEPPDDEGGACVPPCCVQGASGGGGRARGRGGRGGGSGAFTAAEGAGQGEAVGTDTSSAAAEATAATAGQRREGGRGASGQVRSWWPGRWPFEHSARRRGWPRQQQWRRAATGRRCC